MDRLSVMRAFCRIVERGTIVRAAEDLGVSPALLSRDLKLLEESLGCTLLSRTTRRMSLTAHGRVYYEDSQRILADVAAAEQRVRADAGAVAGPLRVNAPNSLGVAVLSGMLPRFRERFPDVELTVAFQDQVVDMIEGGFDLSIRVRAALPDSALIARPIAPVHQRLFASPNYLSDRGTPAAPSDLANHPTVAFLHADPPFLWDLSGPDGRAAIDIRPRLSLGSSLVLRDMLAAGAGIGALPGFLSDPWEKSGRLERVLPEWELPQRTVYAVTASRLSADARTLAFIDMLSEYMK